MMMEQAPKLTPAQKRVADLKAKLKQAQALAQKQAARARSKEVGEQRKAENRIKVLVGAFILDGATDPLRLLNVKGQTLADWLTRDDERAVFGLAPLPKPATEQPEQQVM